MQLFKTNQCKPHPLFTLPDINLWFYSFTKLFVFQKHPACQLILKIIVPGRKFRLSGETNCKYSVNQNKPLNSGVNERKKSWLERVEPKFCEQFSSRAVFEPKFFEQFSSRAIFEPNFFEQFRAEQFSSRQIFRACSSNARAIKSFWEV